MPNSPHFVCKILLILSLFLFATTYGQGTDDQTLKQLTLELGKLESDGPSLQRLETIGQLYLALKDYRNAAGFLHMAVEKNNANADTTLKLVSVYLTAGKTDGALALLESGAKTFPESVPLLVELGSAYSAFENYRSAIVIFNRALEVDPENSNIQYLLAGAWFSYGDFEQAKPAILTVIEAGDPSVDSVILYGQVLSETGSIRKGIREVERIYKNDPDNELIRDALIGLLLKNATQEADAGRISRALRALEHANEVVPENTDVLMGLALFQHQLGETQIAIQFCKEILEINPQQQRTYIFLGRLQRTEGQAEEALETFSKGLQIAILNKNEENIQIFEQLLHPL